LNYGTSASFAPEEVWRGVRRLAGKVTTAVRGRCDQRDAREKGEAMARAGRQ